MENNKTLGIKIIASIDVLFGLYFLLMIIYSSLQEKFDVANVILLVVITPLIVLPFVLTGFSTFKLRSKSRIRNIYLAIFGILMAFSVYGNALFVRRRLQGETGVDPGTSLYAKILSFLLLLYFIWTIVYLSMPKVKEQFK